METVMATEQKPTELLAVGVFRAKPIEGALTKSTKGSDQYMCNFQFLEGPNAGKHITWWGGFEGKGFKYTTDALAILGWDKKTKLSAWKPSAECVLVIEHRDVPASSDKPARKVASVKYINSLDGKGGGLSIEKFKMNPADEEAASDKILARLAAAGVEDGGEAPNQFQSDADEELPY